MENAFRDGEIKTTGTDIEKLMPPVSRFGGSNRDSIKQKIIDKLKGFFERFFGIGGAFKAEKVSYDMPEADSMSIAAEDKSEY